MTFIVGSEGGPPKDSSLALGPEDRKALPQPEPGHSLPHPIARNQEVRTEGLSLHDSGSWTSAVGLLLMFSLSILHVYVLQLLFLVPQGDSSSQFKARGLRACSLYRTGGIYLTPLE